MPRNYARLHQFVPDFLPPSASSNCRPLTGPPEAITWLRAVPTTKEDTEHCNEVRDGVGGYIALLIGVVEDVEFFGA